MAILYFGGPVLKGGIVIELEMNEISKIFSLFFNANFAADIVSLN